MRISRRSLLLGALGLVTTVTGIGTAMISDVLPGGAPLRRAFGMTGLAGTIPDVSQGPVTAEEKYSAARGRAVNVVTMLPEGAAPRGLSVCVALHVRGGDAHWWLGMGMPRFLTAAARAGVPPFAVVAVDGGADSYWVDTHRGDDPQRMLVEELPAWLAGRGFRNDGVPAAVFGISMGGFGALRYARRRPDLAAVAVASPALFPDWSGARSRKVFPDEAHWAANEPLRHLDAVRGTRLGVWCGTEDPFVGAARTLANRVRPEVVELDRGAHENGYWLRIMPDVLAFLGNRLN